MVDSVWNALPEAVHQSLTGRSNNKGTPPKRILKVLLIDLYVTWLDGPDLCIGIARSDGAWRPTSRYNATHIPKKLNAPYCRYQTSIPLSHSAIWIDHQNLTQI